MVTSNRRQQRGKVLVISSVSFLFRVVSVTMLAWAKSPPIVSSLGIISTRSARRFTNTQPTIVSKYTRRKVSTTQRPSALDDFLEQVSAEPITVNPAETTNQNASPWSWKKTTTPTPNKLSTTKSTVVDPSPVDVQMIRNRTVHIKRDDLLRLPTCQLSGNKARKFWSLAQIPPQDFPKRVISYGGPQSNSMLALAALVHSKNNDPLLDESHTPTRFCYYTKQLPRFLRNQPNGNLFRAQSLGMELCELSLQEYRDWFEAEGGGNPDAPPPELEWRLSHDNDKAALDWLWVPQGGAFGWAYEGAQQLALEIINYWKENGRDEDLSDETEVIYKPLSVILPGGTCATAALVHHALQAYNGTDSGEAMDIRIVVVPCVGDAAYARRQMQTLSEHIGASPEDLPCILPASPSEDDLKYFSFGEPDPVLLQVFEELRDSYNLVVDLIYGAPTWALLFRHWEQTISLDMEWDPNNPLAGRELMYVHSGGLEGINSQLLRYKYKGLLSIDEIQLPGKSKRGSSI